MGYQYGGEILFRQDQLRIQTISSRSIKIYEGDSNNTVTFSSTKINLKYLAGNSTSYVCVNAKGDIFRKNSPCI